ncbi:MAG TPA: hypothetical protein VI958_04855 [Acidobacteriota bacterium]
MNKASKAFRASWGEDVDSNVRSTKTAGLKNAHAFRTSLGLIRATIGLLHSNRELVMKKEQFVQVCKSELQLSHVASIATSPMATIVFPHLAQRIPERAVPPSRMP